MTKPKILVVEDEGVVAADIEESLVKMGYSVVGAAASAVSAIRKAVETEPDLVLMDIKLKGTVDGVDAASELHERLGIPVVYLTAHADAEILERAKKSSPLGYVLKPFDERSLRSAVEIALHKHPQEQKLIENERRLVMALRSVDEAVILTDSKGAITLMNRVAESFTGWKQADAVGKPVKDVFTCVHANRGGLMTEPVGRVLREGVGIGLGDKRIVVSKQGSETWIQGSAVPLRDEDGAVVGAATVFHAADLTADDTSRAARPYQSSRFESLGRVAGHVAENFSDTLKTVSESRQSILECLPESNPARGNVEKALSALDQSLSLADRLLSYTQRRVARPATFQLNELVTDMQDLLQCVAGNDVELLSHIDPAAGKVNADRGHIEQVLLGLVTLAREAMPTGGKLTIETGCVELKDDSEGPVGLAPGYYDSIFVSHTGEADESTASQLPPDLVELVQLACGGVAVHSEPGRVTTVGIYLPDVL